MRKFVVLLCTIMVSGATLSAQSIQRGDGKAFETKNETPIGNVGYEYPLGCRGHLNGEHPHMVKFGIDIHPKKCTIMKELKPKTTKIEKGVVGAYHKIEDAVVGTYQNIEEAVVGAYQKIEDKFVDTFLDKTETQNDK